MCRHYLDTTFPSSWRANGHFHRLSENPGVGANPDPRSHLLLKTRTGQKQFFRELSSDSLSSEWIRIQERIERRSFRVLGGRCLSSSVPQNLQLCARLKWNLSVNRNTSERQCIDQINASLGPPEPSNVRDDLLEAHRQSNADHIFLRRGNTEITPLQSPNLTRSFEVLRNRLR